MTKSEKYYWNKQIKQKHENICNVLKIKKRKEKCGREINT